MLKILTALYLMNQLLTVISVSVNLNIEVTNALNGHFDLIVYCHNIGKVLTLHSNTSYEWHYYGDVRSTKPPFLFYFQWSKLQIHSYNLFTPLWDYDCKEQCHWFITEIGPCKYTLPNSFALNGFKMNMLHVSYGEDLR